MKHIILTFAALLPLLACATEESDTTFTVKDRKIVVDFDGSKTTVQVYDMKNREQTKTREVEFVDGQEIERVYVTSPFIPQVSGQGKRKLNSHYPFMYIGFNTLSDNVMGFGGNAEMHTRDSKSWELGFTLASVAFGLTRSTALTSALSFWWVHNHFQGNYVLTTTDGQTSMRLHDADLKKSYISYKAVRIPVMWEWQRRIGRNDLFVSAGASVEMRFKEHSRYIVGKSKRTETGDINLNPLGLNLELSAGYGFICLYGRAAVTPLLKTDFAPRCYPVSFGIGISI